MARMGFQNLTEPQQPVQSCAAEADPAAHEPAEEEVRQRAHVIWLARNGTPDDCAWDWHQAEHELRGRRTLGLT